MVEMKLFPMICNTCGYVGPMVDFVFDERSPRQRRNRCSKCAREMRFKEYQANPEKFRAIQRNHYRARPGYLAKKARNYRYRITTEIYEQMLDKQNKACAICLRPPSENKILCVDHDHRCCPGSETCGKCMRGLLCHT